MKPMLAATLKNFEDVQLPVYVSPKLDGIRCLIVNGQAVSRTLKPIPNTYVQEQLAGLPDGLDGELMMDGDFNTIQSAIMSKDGQPEFTYVVFDKISKDDYGVRYYECCAEVKRAKNPRVQIIYTVETNSLDDLKDMEEGASKMYEGIMIRRDNGGYKFGRSTLSEGHLLKLKRFEDSEGTISGFEELMTNTNKAETDELGHTKRSSKKEGLVPAGMLGALVVEKDGIKFNIGTGFTREQRKEIWDNQDKYVGKTVTYMYQELGEDGVTPRFPIYKGVRLEN